jgi:WD40 repeat protein
VRNRNSLANVWSTVLAASCLLMPARNAGASEPPGPGEARGEHRAAAIDGGCRADPTLELVRRIEWPGNHVFHTAFSPDRGLYLGGGDTGTVRIWEVATGNQLLELPVVLAWFTPDGKQLLGHTADRILSIFDLSTGKEERTWEAPEIFGSVSISPDGKKVVTGHADKTLRIWDFASGMELLKLEGHDAQPSAFFSPDGKQILSTSADKTIRLWDAETGKTVRTFDDFKDVSPQPGTDLIIQAFFLPGGQQIAAYVWGTENTLRVVDATNGKLVRKIDLGEEFHKDLAVSADGRWFLTGNGGDRSVRLRDLTTGKEATRSELADVNVPRAVGFSPDGNYAVAGSHRGWVYLWRIQK